MHIILYCGVIISLFCQYAVLFVWLFMSEMFVLYQPRNKKPIEEQGEMMACLGQATNNDICPASDNVNQCDKLLVLR